jgi:hypothetical protein
MPKWYIASLAFFRRAPAPAPPLPPLLRQPATLAVKPPVPPAKFLSHPLPHLDRVKKITFDSAAYLPDEDLPQGYSEAQNSTGWCLSCHRHSSTPSAHSAATRPPSPTRMWRLELQNIDCNPTDSAPPRKLPAYWTGQQCCGSGSGSTCFWASRIRILLSSCKNSKKKP